MKLGKTSKKAWKFLIKNYFIVIFIACIAFVGVVSAYKMFFSKPSYVYVKVKVGQGLWWASTQKPNIWFVNALKDIKEEKDLSGKPTVKVLKIEYYPSIYQSGYLGQYDVYITAMLKVSQLGKSGKYNFNRSTIGIGAPIDFEFSKVQFSGTITELSERPLNENYIEKTVYLTKKYASQLEYQDIKVGDEYSNGQEVIFKILEKSAGDINELNIIDRSDSETVDLLSEKRLTIFVKATIKVKKTDGKLIFAEEQMVVPQNRFIISTENFVFKDFFVSKIE
ncbi:hypothetical protein GYA28_02180 [Candidatus Roizmanbacteria bacterium]|jgi:hypothetical protein|nr:hypothetical protein [Candidatus Roizmanbacteria bacterium]